MQQFDARAAQEWFLGLFQWREKRSGMIAPNERLPWGDTIAMGFQHVLAMFGSTVLAPILMGFDSNVAIFFSGIGTLLFFLITGGRIPSYLGSSFGFIGPVLAVLAVAGTEDIPKALGGIVIAGLVYTLIGFVVHFFGSEWIDNLMPPIVTGGVVAIIGLNLAGAARGMAQEDMGLAILTILAILAVALFGRGLLGRLPILLGTAIGYLLALVLGGTNPEGREILGWQVSGVDLGPVGDASFFGMPNFTTPSFDGNAIALIAPVSVVLVAENTGHIKAVSEMTRQNLMPYLGRGFIGDGVATMVSGMGGGTGVTTYAENIGVMAVTRVFSTAIFLVASGVAILLGFSPKFGALINSIPLGVLGGVSTVLFGLIAAAGIRIWIDNRVDFSKGINLFLAAVTLIVGTADYTVSIGNFDLNGIALGTFGSIILYQIFRFAPGAADDDPGATPASAGEPNTHPYEFAEGAAPAARGGGRQRSGQRQPRDPRAQQQPSRPRQQEPRTRQPRPELYEEEWPEEPEVRRPSQRPAQRPAQQPAQRSAPQDPYAQPPEQRPAARPAGREQAPPRQDPRRQPVSRGFDEAPQMPPPPTIPPPPTRRAQRPASAPEPRYDYFDEIVIDDPNAMPQGPQGGEYDFHPEEPRQAPRRPSQPRRARPDERPRQDTWDDDFGYDDDPAEPDGRLL
jgi:putative pyrimidine permease RutG